MSNLLMDEHPIVISPKLADVVGLGESIVLQQIHYWLQNTDNVHEGRKWTYNSYAKWQEQFIFWSESTIKRNITSLQKKGLLLVSNFNKAKFDKTKWYSIDYDQLKIMEAEYEIRKAKEKAEKKATEQGDNRTGQVDPTSGSDCTDGTGQVDLTSGSDCTDGTGQVDQTNTLDYTETTSEITTETTTTKSPLQSDDFGKLYQFYEKNFNPYVAPAVVDMMNQDFEEFNTDLIQYAMDEAVMRSKTNYGYVRSILNRCKHEGIKTRQEAEHKAQMKSASYNNKQNQSSEKTPKWIEQMDNDNQQEHHVLSEDDVDKQIDIKKKLSEFRGEEWTPEREAEEKRKLEEELKNFWKDEEGA